MKKKPEVFFRMKELGKLQPGDHYDAYQIEVVKYVDGKWKKSTYGNPEVKEFVVGRLENLILDPRELEAE